MYFITEKTKEAIEDRLNIGLREEYIGLSSITFEEDYIRIEFKSTTLSKKSIGVTRERVAVNLVRAVDNYTNIYLELETDEYCFENGQANELVFRVYK